MNKADIYQKLRAKSDRCHYCGIREGDFWHVYGRYFRGGRRGRRLELDRRDPKNKHYTLANCVLACYPCNDAKSDIFSYREFKVIGRAIRRVWKKKNKR